MAFERENSFQDIYDGINDAIFLHNPETGKILDVNRKMCEMYGYSRQQALKLSVEDVSSGQPPFNQANALGQIRKASTGESQLLDWLAKDSDGRLFWVEVSMCSAQIAGVEGVLVVARDISERKQAAQALRESEERYRTLVENIPGTIYRCETEPPWRMKHISGEVLKLTGHPASDFLSEKLLFDDLIHPDDVDEVKHIVAEGIAASQPFALQYRVQHVDGSVRWVHERGMGIKDDQGNPRWLDGVIVDITARKEAEEALRESEERYRAFFENSRDAFMTLGQPSWKFTSANPAMVTLFGAKDEAEMISVTPWNVSPPFQPDGRPSDDKAREMIETALREGTLFFEWTHKRLDGEEFPATVFLTRLELGGQTMLQATVRDITKQKQSERDRLTLERQVRHAQKLESLGVLAGGIAHDFNNLLMVIIGNADLALRDISLDASARENVQEIMEASKRAADLAQQMLAYSGKGRFVVESLDLSRMVEDMAHMLKASISKKAVLKHCFAQNLPAIQGDATQLRQVIMNLITNASDAIGDKSGVISIATGLTHLDRADIDDTYLKDSLPEGLYETLEVTDTGCGMGADTQAKLFDPFFTTKMTGRGLGMAAVLGIIRGHKGVIKIRSQLGKGTTITVLLPAIEAAPAAARPRSEAAGEWHGVGTVLLVDDEESVRKIGRRMLERLGMTVITASNGKEAVEVFRRQTDKIDCVILDLTMPQMNGIEARQEIYRIRADVPVIISSGYDEQDVTQQLGGRGQTNFFIQKPYEIPRLAATLREVLDKVLSNR